MQVARVAEIHRYPVKSMLGEQVEEIAIGADGLRGDRTWAARDEGRSSIEGGRKLPALLNCAARYPEPPSPTGPVPVPEITLPDGTRLSADDPAVAARLSELAGRPLSLWPLRPASDEDHYRRGAPDHEDMMEELRAIFARLPEEPLPDLGALPREVLFASTFPGTYFDCYPLFLLTQTSLESLAKAWPDSRFDRRRFRPNILLEAEEGDGFPENAWVGKRVRIGDAVLSINVECPRCVMTTHPIAELPKDPKVMRALVKENGGNLGVYASIEQPGVVRRGDAVEVIGDTTANEA